MIKHLPLDETLFMYSIKTRITTVLANVLLHAHSRKAIPLQQGFFTKDSLIQKKFVYLQSKTF